MNTNNLYTIETVLTKNKHYHAFISEKSKKNCAFISQQPNGNLILTTQLTLYIEPLFIEKDWIYVGTIINSFFSTTDYKTPLITQLKNKLNEETLSPVFPKNTKFITDLQNAILLYNQFWKEK